MSKSSSDFVVVWVTVPEAKLSGEIARGLVEAKLAACVSELPRARSHYFWEGKLETAEETVLMIKTRNRLLPALARYVKEKHSSQVPEIICTPITDGSREYLEWVGANLDGR